jgi:pyridoxal phosphate enzyme (YggS family)
VPAGEQDQDSHGEVAALRRARDDVLARIRAAAGKVGRGADEVTLVAVSKTVPAERLRDAVAAGLVILGENRVQEAEAKVGEVPGAAWHLVGPLQSNKARRAVAIFDAIESVDSLELARRLDRLAAELRPGRPLPVLVQVNVDRDAAKAGFSPDGIAGALPDLLALPALRVEGLMTIGRLVASPEAARASFRALRELATQLRARWPGLGPELSMGMSDDFEVAVEEGATIVRVGRALFGARPARGADPPTVPLEGEKPAFG